jgi:probable phosphoglycerate mutase
MSDVSPTYIYPLTLLRSRSETPAPGGAGDSQLDLDDIGEILRLSDEDAAELLFIRHGEPACGVRAGRQAPLSITGRVQAHLLASRLRDLWVERIYSAPECYAVETARLVGNTLERPLSVVSGLREIEFKRAANGSAGGAGPALRDRFTANPNWDALPGCEPSGAFRERITNAIDGLLAPHRGQRIVIVTHASVINAYLSRMLGIPRDLFFCPEFASISVVRWLEDLYAVRGLNDTAHLTSACGPWLAYR